MNNSINSYDYKPVFNFFKTGKEKDDKLFVGFELEAENIDDITEPEDLIEGISEIINDKEQFVYYKHDGSLNNGIEVVSMPFSLEYIRENKNKIEEMLEYMKKEGYKSHDPNTCGLHFHINKDYFGKTSKEVEDNIDKLILFSEYYKDKLINFSRRNDFGYCHFLGDQRGLTEEQRLNLFKIKKEKFNVDRYMVVNIENPHTVEFRLIRGTLNYNTFMASIEFIFSLARVIKNKKITEISWDDVICYEGNIFTQQYCIDKGIKSDTKKMKDYSIDYLKNQNKIKAQIKKHEREIVIKTYNMLVKSTKQTSEEFLKLSNKIPQKFCGNIKLNAFDIKYEEKNAFVLLNQYLIDILKYYKNERKFLNRIDYCIDNIKSRKSLEKAVKKVDKNFIDQLERKYIEINNLKRKIDVENEINDGFYSF